MRGSNRSRRYPFLIVVLLATSATQLAGQVRHEFTQVHMGMPVRIVLYAPDVATARTAAVAAFQRVAELDDTFSDYRAASELRRLESHAGRWLRISEPLFDVLRRALDIARLTDGAFDPTIGPLVTLWREARRTGTLPAPSALDSARQLVGSPLLQLDTTRRRVRLARPGMRLDLGGIAKGYVLDAALRALRHHGIHAALLEAGGDIVVGAPPPGAVGWIIDTPGAAPAFAARAATLRGAALSTSGATSQYFELDGIRYSHIIDPRTARAVTRPVLARVIAADAALADALATALSVDPGAADRLRRRFPDILIDIATVRPPRARR